jgi:hypothetical protein
VLAAPFGTPPKRFLTGCCGLIGGHHGPLFYIADHRSASANSGAAHTRVKRGVEQFLLWLGLVEERSVRSLPGPSESFWSHYPLGRRRYYVWHAHTGLISFFGVPLHSLRHHGYGKGCYNVRLGLSLLLVVRTASPSLKLKDIRQKYSDGKHKKNSTHQPDDLARWGALLSRLAKQMVCNNQQSNSKARSLSRRVP